MQMDASDLFMTAGGFVSVKDDGILKAIGTEKLRPSDTEEMINQMYELAGRSMDEFNRRGDDDFSFSLPGLARFRVSAYRQRASSAAVVRVVSFSIPNWEELDIPASIMELSDVDHGLVIVTGTAGSGKSTSQACIIDRINHTRPCHIITLEDPIEFLHRNDKAIVSQREVSIDTEDYQSGLRACLRQAPDVILLGEMRDPETIRTAMTAAETGHMVIATLHTKGAANSIDRIIDAFPASQQNQIRVQLATVLHSVVCQQLIPGVNGELIPAFEVMHTNSAIRNLIREGKTHQIPSAIAGGAEEGMWSMDQYIADLCRAGKISKDVALENADNPEQLRRRIGG